MRSDKLPYLDKRISVTFTMKRRTIIMFKKRCDELGLNKNQVIETMLNEFLTT